MVKNPVVEIDDDGSKVECWYNDSNKLHREDGPAEISYHNNGKIHYEIWYKDDRLHREDGPAGVGYRENGTVYCEYWYKDGTLHREDGPAVIGYHKDGKIRSERWFRDDKPYMAKEKSI